MLRALHEAGVKIDIVAGRGVGVVGALFAAVDGAQRLWDEKGFWRAPDVQSLYRWRAVPRAVAWALAASVAIVALPTAAVAVGLVVFPIDFLLKMVGAGGAAGLVGAYLRFADAAFAPDMLPVDQGHPCVERAFWLLGGRLATSEQPGQELRFTDYPDSGIVMFLQDADRTRCTFRTGPHPGLHYMPGHMHSDVLSVTLTTAIPAQSSDVRRFPLIEKSADRSVDEPEFVQTPG